MHYLRQAKGIENAGKIVLMEKKKKKSWTLSTFYSYCEPYYEKIVGSCSVWSCRMTCLVRKEANNCKNSKSSHHVFYYCFVFASNFSVAFTGEKIPKTT